MHANMMRAYGRVLGRLGRLLRNVERTAPVERFDTSVLQTPGAGIILASREARYLQRRRVPKNFLLGTPCRHASTLQRNTVLADAISLFEIVAHEKRRSSIRLQRFA